MNPVPLGSETRLLLIGYGNTLRSDDAVGHCVAQQVESLGLPGVKVLTCPVLTPELAAPISQARSVVFVDATVDNSVDVLFRELTPAESSRVLTHIADPRTLLALARDVFGYAPTAWWLTIPVENLALGEKISARALRGIAQAVEHLRAMPH